MQYIHKILIILVIFILKMNLNNCTKPPPWFMHGEYLYYVNIEQNFSSNFTQSLCDKLGMSVTISRLNAIQLLPHLRQSYGDFPGLWTYKNEFFNNVLNTHIKMQSCFQFNASSENFQPKSCTEKSGYICKVRMTSATLFYKNSLQHVYKNDIKQYCDPQLNLVKNDLYSCLIHL
ncbi:uncharacterized protein LOC119609580 [Lucilia sericata]|uniref:uncharacterized protein LOC119609580 n=1 Tax=Lucilia sericata TaxID=13632 RepID=UPI0018A815AD|nr:uncharacterized protein LOC119609580 [Lucilia sericata]